MNFKTVGVSGAIASGKSTFVKTFLNVLDELDVPNYHFDADKKTHDVIRKEHKDIAKMLQIEDLDLKNKENENKFVQSIWNRILPNSSTSTSHLNNQYQEFMWKQIQTMLLEEQKQFFSKLKNNNEEKGVFIFDAAFLFSANWDAFSDMIIKVVADKEQREERYINRIKQKIPNITVKDDVLKAQFKSIEEIGAKEKQLDRDRNRKIIFTMNNTNTTGDVPLMLEAKAVYTSLFEEKPW